MTAALNGQTGAMRASAPISFMFALASLAATPAQADIRYLAYDAADRVTQAMTRGLTLEVERGLFGAVRLNGLYSTTSRGSARLERGGPDGVRRALPEGTEESDVYAVEPEGDGRGLSRALCPGADAAWLVAGRVRAARPLTMHAVGRWADGTFRQCVTLNYAWRGEWAVAPTPSPAE
jgi:hypothetical protein